MYQIKVENCNNIREGMINIVLNKLNIKYGINGTGKTTLAKAIQFANNSDELSKLQSYFSDEISKVTITPTFNKILVFNEDFVNQVVFVEDEVIENSFEVFLKTPDYDAKKLQLDSHLQTLKNVLQNDSEIIKLQNDLAKINQKFKRTPKGKLSNTGAMKSLLSKQNLYNIPSELDEYRPFLDNTDINISWIDWKNKGEAFDIEDNCPYCSEKFDIPKHTKQKEIFKTLDQNDLIIISSIAGGFFNDHPDAMRAITRCPAYIIAITQLETFAYSDKVDMILRVGNNHHSLIGKFSITYIFEVLEALYHLKYGSKNK